MHGRKVEADAAVSTTDGAGARCCLAGSSHKDGVDVAKATGMSTSVSILLLFHFTLQKAAKRSSARNPPPTRISLPEFISIESDIFFSLNHLNLMCKCIYLSKTSICQPVRA